MTRCSSRLSTGGGVPTVSASIGFLPFFYSTVDGLSGALGTGRVRDPGDLPTPARFIESEFVLLERSTCSFPSFVKFSPPARANGARGCPERKAKRGKIYRRGRGSSCRNRAAAGAGVRHPLEFLGEVFQNLGRCQESLNLI